MPENGQQIPDIGAMAAQKKAGLVNIALTIVCQQTLHMDSPDEAHAVHKKACNIVSELLDEFPKGTGVGDLTISSAPLQ